jgi:hypothetical protein
MIGLGRRRVTIARPHSAISILTFIRAGYPEGVPGAHYVALLGVRQVGCPRSQS